MTSILGPIFGAASSWVLSAFNRYLDRRRSRAGSALEVVSLRIQRFAEGDGEFPFLEVMIRNRDDVSHVIHEVELSEIKEWRFARDARFRQMPVSWNYDVDLDAGPSVTVPMQQELPGGDADRFSLRIGRTAIPPVFGVVIFSFSGRFLC